MSRGHSWCFEAGGHPWGGWTLFGLAESFGAAPLRATGRRRHSTLGGAVALREPGPLDSPVAPLLPLEQGKWEQPTFRTFRGTKVLDFGPYFRMERERPVEAMSPLHSAFLHSQTHASTLVLPSVNI